MAEYAGDGGKRLLLCTNHLQDLAGSEVVTIELAEHFLERGWAVDIYTNLLGEPVLSELLALPAWGRLRIVEASPDEPFDEHYDLIWMQHALLPPSFVERLATGLTTPVVWHHLSSFMTIELPILAEFESELACLSSSMSVEALAALERLGLDPRKFVLFDNPAPDRFADAEVEAPSEALGSVLIVSNHPPAELEEAAVGLRARGVTVDHLGDVAGATPRRISPEILAPYDAVVTIGKTVQAALSMGIPVYAYDHFGGCGWITAENLEEQAAGNFAGRQAPRTATADDIVAELLEGYRSAASWASATRRTNGERWRLSTRIDAVLEDPRLVRVAEVRLGNAELERYRAFVSLHGDLFRYAKTLERELATTKAELKAERSRSADLLRDARVAREVAARADQARMDERAVLAAERIESEHLETLRASVQAIVASRSWLLRRFWTRGPDSIRLSPSAVISMSRTELESAAEELARSRWLRIVRRFRLRNQPTARPPGSRARIHE